MTVSDLSTTCFRAGCEPWVIVDFVVWTAVTVTTTGALVILYLCLGGFFVGMLAISKKIRNDGDTVRVVGVCWGRPFVCLQ